MFCPNCGKEINEESTFCPECGGKIDKHSDLNNNKSNEKPKFNKKIAIIILAVVLLCVAAAIVVFIVLNTNKPSSDIYTQIDNKIASEEFNQLSNEEQIDQVTNLLIDAAKAGTIADDYDYDSDTQIFSFTYDDGRLGAIDMSKHSSELNGASINGTKDDNLNLGSSLINSQKAFADDANKKVHIMYAFGDERKDLYIKTENDWRNLGLDVSVDYDVTVDDFLHLSGFNTVLFSMHGTVYKNRPVLCLTEIADDDKDWKYGDYELNNTMVKTYNKETQCTNYWILPEFFGKNLQQGSLSNCAVLSESCDFLGSGKIKDGVSPEADRSFPNNLEHAGASCSSGFYNSVWNKYSVLIQFNTIEYMVKDNITIGESFEKCKQEFGNNDSVIETEEKKETAFPYIFGNLDFSIGDIEKGKAQKKKQAAVNAYIDYINKNLKQNKDNVYVVVDLDGDDIPEIYVQGPDVASGDHLLMYGNNVVSDITGLDTVAMANCGTLYYYKGENKFCISGGRMGHYEDLVYSISNGKFVCHHKGIYKDDPSKLGTLIYTYDGVTMDEGSYNSALKKDFDTSSATNVKDSINFVYNGKGTAHYEGNNVYYYDGIISYLKSLV